MPFSPLKTVAVVFAFGLVGALWFQQGQRTGQLQGEKTRLLEELATTRDSLANTQAARERAEIDAGRWRGSQNEWLRLRSEVAQLRRELAARDAAAVKSVPTNPPPARVAPTVVQTPPQRPHVSAWQANVPVGGTVLSRSLASAPGRGALLLTTPTVAPEAEGRGIAIQTHEVEGSEETLSRLGLAALFSGETALGNVLLSADQSRALIELFQGSEGLEILSHPRVITTSGRTAEISTVEASGRERSLQFTPQIAADGSVDLAVKQTVPMAAEPAPPAPDPGR